MLRRDQSPQLKLVIDELERRDISAYDAAALLGIHVRNARAYMAVLYKEKTTYISAWRSPRNGPKVAVYSLREDGDVDARKPARKKIVRSRELGRNPLNRVLMNWS